MKNVLLPTDLSVQSLAPVHQIVRDAKNEKPVVYVVHMLSLPTSITDLLFMEEKKPYKSVPGHFIEAFQMLANKYKNLIQKIEFKLIYCSTSRYLNNFIEGNNIDSIYMLDNFNYRQPLPESQKFIGFIQKCKAELIKVPLQPKVLSEYQILSPLLGTDMKKPVALSTHSKPTVTYS